MKKQMKGWKVISSMDRLSARSQYGFVDRALYVLNYPVGVKVTPKDKNSRLFFFAKEFDAVRFSGTGEIVVPCVATGVSKIKYICHNRLDFEEFWQNKKSKKHIKVDIEKNVPDGSFVAKSITCLE